MLAHYAEVRRRKTKSKGVWGIGNTFDLQKILRSPKAPQNLLVNQLIFLAAEAWEQGTISVTALDGYLENLKFRSSVAQHCLFHNRKFYLLNHSVNYSAGAGSGSGSGSGRITAEPSEYTGVASTAERNPQKFASASASSTSSA